MVSEAERADVGRPADGAWGWMTRIATAHVVMLRNAGILDDDGAAVVLDAIDAAGAGAPVEAVTPSGLVAAFDERVDSLSQAATEGAASIGRARAEGVATLVRLQLRTATLDLEAALRAVWEAALDLADRHAFTLMPALADGQPVQVTTFAHLLGGVIGPVGRQSARLRGEWDGLDRSPMGAGVLASSGWPVDRERMAALLGFGGIVDNTIDAVAAVDHLTGLAALARGALAICRRLVVDVLGWLRAESDSFRLGEDWRARAVDPAIPQFRPASGMIEWVDRTQRLDGDLAGLARTAAAAGFGPATTTLDTVAWPLIGALGDVVALIERFAALCVELEPNRAYLANRCGRDHTTSGELTDYLIAEEGVRPAAARTIAAMTIRRAIDEGREASAITPDLIDASALLVIGRELGIEVEAIGRHLAPRRVLERRTARGSPNPEMTREWLERERESLAAARHWRVAINQRLSGATTRLSEAEAEIRAAAD